MCVCVLCFGVGGGGWRTEGSDDLTVPSTQQTQRGLSYGLKRVPGGERIVPGN